MSPHIEVAENNSPLLLWEILMMQAAEEEEGALSYETSAVAKSCYIDELHDSREHGGQLGGAGDHHDIQMLRPVGTLGRGNMGTVVLVVSKQCSSNNESTDDGDMQPFAMKVMKKHAHKKQRSRRAHTEREILSSLHHPFLQSLHANFESDKHSLLLLDFCPGGDLNVLRQKQPDKRFTETATRFYAAEVLDALEHLHKMGIVYRDLKPENILIQESGHVMLTDFDLSLRLDEPEGMAPPSRLGLNIADQDTCARSKGNQYCDKEYVDVDEEAGDGRSTSYAACLGSCISGVRRGMASNGEFRSSMYCCAAARASNCGSGVQQQINGERYNSIVAASASPPQNYCKQEKVKGKASTRLTAAAAAAAGSDHSKMNNHRSAKLGGAAGGEGGAGRGGEWFFVGTEEYVAPEILSGQEHGYGVDWWAYGILLYELIYGATPFKGRTRRDTFANIMGREPAFPGTPTPLKDLIQRLLVKDPARRLAGGPAIRAHPFFAGVLWASLPQVCRPPVIPSPFCLPTFEAAAKRRAAAAAAHAAAAAARLAARSCQLATSASSSHCGAATSSDFFPGRRDSSSSSKSSCQIGGSSPSCSSRCSDSPARDDQLSMEDIFSQFSMQSQQP